MSVTTPTSSCALLIHDDGNEHKQLQPADDEIEDTSSMKETADEAPLLVTSVPATSDDKLQTESQ